MTTLHAEPRTSHGTRASFNLRRDGRLPAVVYGEGGETVAVSVDSHAFEAVLRHHERVVDLELDGKAQQVLIHEVHWDHMGDTLMHIDFKRASRGTKVEVEVALEFVGHAKGAAKGEFVKNVQEVAVSCTPRSIPEKLVVHISDLDVGETIHASDLEMPEGVELLTEPSTVICGIHARSEEEETEGEEGAEGAEPEVIGKGKSSDEEPEGDA
jgi:large subunit ribosomal protein L25